ncbi:PrnB family protein [Elongatibacter sediminis]|uniref:Monodechloroaminopyrrolnitrin synthase PrnB family protein n=1 Tax=Elongatibacter sediminis TaxID=3119006 RepID=A0AAW9RF84_9GAMM
MSPNTEALDHWIRTGFREMNTELEEIYFAQDARHEIPADGADLRRALRDEGRDLIKPLLVEGNTDEGFEAAYDLLGCVGLYMAACRRHEITEPSRERTSPLLEASALALHLSMTLGVSPRFASSHLTTNNSAPDGAYRSFTSLEDERIFIDYNTLGVFAYMRAADALRRILPLGVAHPLAVHLFGEAKAALDDVTAWNDRLFRELDADRFFYCVRPYYKPYRVGPKVYRGANAGDFAGINVIDVLLGLCSADNPDYAQILNDKFLFMQPEDQAILKDCMRRESFLNAFLKLHRAKRRPDTYQRNLAAYLEVVDAHGRGAAQHHDQLVTKYIERQAGALPESGLNNLTASGPPLPVLLDSLQRLRDLRTAERRDDIPSRHRELEQLRSTLSAA